MTADKAKALQEAIERILQKEDVHYKVEHVKQPELKFVNLEVSIKVTKEK